MVSGLFDAFHVCTVFRSLCLTIAARCAPASSWPGRRSPRVRAIGGWCAPVRSRYAPHRETIAALLREFDVT